MSAAKATNGAAISASARALCWQPNFSARSDAGNFSPLRTLFTKTAKLIFTKTATARRIFVSDGAAGIDFGYATAASSELRFGYSIGHQKPPAHRQPFVFRFERARQFRISALELRHQRQLANPEARQSKPETR
jgi:hypothetical protein